MKKFFILLKKEIKELITPQTVLPLVITAIMFMALGNVLGKEVEKTKKPSKILVVDEDKSTSSRGVSEFLGKSTFQVIGFEGNEEAAVKKAKDEKISVIAVIPKGFENGLSKVEPQTITAYTIMGNFSLLTSQNSAILDSIIAAINDYTSNQLILAKTSVATPAEIKNPVRSENIVVVGDRQANVNPQQIMNFIMSQTTFIPIILFMVIIFSATMIATTIATEKENKTLETLLTVPVNRNHIVLAKMVGAGLISLFSAAVYMFGFRYYINGLSGGAATSGTDEATKAALGQLGLSFGTSQYAILGISLFFGILCALAISIIIGAFAEDVKSIQGLITPLMILVTIPYILTLFLDINTMPPVIKWLIYAIPFSHPFLAAPNILLHNYSFVVYGILYQAIIFVLFVIIAARLFSTDAISTMKLSFGKKK